MLMFYRVGKKSKNLREGVVTTPPPPTPPVRPKVNFGRKYVKPDIDFHLVHLNYIQLFPVSKEESKWNSNHTI